MGRCWLPVRGVGDGILKNERSSKEGDVVVIEALDSCVTRDVAPSLEQKRR